MPKLSQLAVLYSIHYSSLTSRVGSTIGQQEARHLKKIVSTLSKRLNFFTTSRWLVQSYDAYWRPPPAIEQQQSDKYDLPDRLCCYLHNKILHRNTFPSFLTLQVMDILQEEPCLPHCSAAARRIPHSRVREPQFPAIWTPHSFTFQGPTHREVLLFMIASFPLW